MIKKKAPVYQATSNSIMAAHRVLAWLALPLWIVKADSFRDIQKKLVVNGVDGSEARANFISFSQYLDSTRVATFKDYSSTNVSNDEAFNEIKKHIFTMYGGITDPKSVKSYIRDEDYIDCLPYLQQPTIHVLKLTAEDLKPPPESKPDPVFPKHTSNDPKDAPLTVPEGSKDVHGNVMKCDKGWVPIRRLSLERITRFRDLGDFMDKPGSISNATSFRIGKRDVARSSDGHKHIHEGARELNIAGERFVGATAGINVWSPGWPFSISQLWVMSTGPTQTVETGWQHSHRYGSYARFFHYYTTNDHARGSGCYGTDCAGFVQEGEEEDGARFLHYSSPGAANQREFTPAFKLEGRRWNLYLVRREPFQRRLVGWYPRHIFNVHGGKLWKGASRVEWGGEVADTETDNMFGPMGSGRRPANGVMFGAAAFQRLLQVLPDTTPPAWRHAELGGIAEDHQRCYNRQLVLAPLGGSWGAQAWFGGPGGDFCDSLSSCPRFGCPASCEIVSPCGSNPHCTSEFPPLCCDPSYNNDECRQHTNFCISIGCL